MKSYWIDSTNINEFSELNKNLDTDVCIIGGGITGLSTAYYLSKANVKTVLLEKDRICKQTTGNSTAKITSQHGLFYNYLIQSQGKDKAKQYFDANEEAIKNIEQIVKDENINCDFEKQSAYVFARKEDDVNKIRDEIEAVKELGGEAKFVDNLELPFETLGAIEFKNQAQFNPYKYAKDLANSMNAEIYEHTKVIDLKEKGGCYEVTTEKGNVVTAKKVVIATHYPIINAPGYYFLKMYQSMSYAIGVETEQELFDGMYISGDAPNLSLRTTQYGDKRLLIIVGLDHKTGESKNLKGNYEALERIAKEFYSDSKIVYKWCTEDCITLDKIPYIGTFSILMPNVYVATGFNKWGITNSNVAANIITDKILGRKNQYEEVFTSTRLKPVKNYQEIGNMLKQTGKSLVIEKLEIPEEKLNDIKIGEGGIIEIDGRKIGIYKDENGKMFKVNPVCSHLGCELAWNNLEKTWDCPCHGSRFAYDGKSIYAPSIKNLQ